MSRTSRSGGPSLKRVESVTLSEKNPKGRLIAIILLLAVAVVAFTMGVMSLLKPDSGWREVEVNPSAQTLCAQDFKFNYQLGMSGIAAPVEYKRLSLAYTEAADEAYKLFSNETFEGVNNVAYLSAHPNEIVTVAPALYDAFILFSEYNSRYLYFAPVYEQYRGLFSCTEDNDAELFDPYANPENQQYFAAIAELVNRPEMIELELLGDHQVKLSVSEEYLAYADENGITNFIDFFWMKNAFVLDYIADAMISQGFTRGTIASFDGFSATLDNSGEEYAFHMYDRIGNTVYPAATFRYTRPMNIVSYHNYPMSNLDKLNYYEYKNGEIRTSYVDSKDGMCKTSLNNLVAFSENRSCAETALVTYGFVATDSFDETAVRDLVWQDVDVIYCKDAEIICTSEEMQFSDLYQDESVTYKVAE